MVDDDLVAGRYRRIRRLGRGGMGEVWLAEDTELDRQVAIKTLRVEGAAETDSASLDRMVREARVAARLRHRHAVVVFDLFRENGHPHIVMEYIEGESLADRLTRVGKMPLGEAAALIGQVAEALAEAHRLGIVHRDIKPANILIDSLGNARLADFGIARGFGDAALTSTGLIVGTVAFMPPEVAHDGKATAASDVWSLGATLYAAVEGRAPYQSDSASGAVQILNRMANEPVPAPQQTGGLTALVMSMLAQEPSGRPTAEETAHRLAGSNPTIESDPKQHETISVGVLPSPTETRLGELGEPATLVRNVERPTTTDASVAGVGTRRSSNPDGVDSALRWVLYVGSFIIVTAVAGIVVWVTSGKSGSANDAGTGGRVQDVPEVAESPSTLPTARTILPGVLGSFSYATTGYEQTSIPGTKRTFPTTTTITNTKQGCGVLHRWKPVEEHVQSQVLCPSDGGIKVESYKTTVTFFGIDSGENFSCSGDSFIERPAVKPGDVWRFKCESPDVIARHVAHAIGVETVSVGGAAVRVLHVQLTTKLTGGETGESTQDYRIAVNKPVIVMETGTVNWTEQGVHYIESYSLTLDRLSAKD